MQIYLSIHIQDYRMAESYHEVYKKFDTLKEADFFYNQYNGKEIFDEAILFEESAEIRYIVAIYEMNNGNIVSFIKAKYKVIDLEDYHKDFWKLYNLVNEANNL